MSTRVERLFLMIIALALLATLNPEAEYAEESASTCRFAARCKFAMDVCTQGLPPLKEVGPGHYVRCVL
mgnify:CR=1 FL=1